MSKTLHVLLLHHEPALTGEVPEQIVQIVVALRARDTRLGLGESSEHGCVAVNRSAAQFQQPTEHSPRQGYRNCLRRSLG